MRPNVKPAFANVTDSMHDRFILPESPRWLLACGHKEKAIQVIRKAAEVNKRTIPDHVLNGEEKGGMGLQDDQSQVVRSFAHCQGEQPNKLLVFTSGPPRSWTCSSRWR